MKQRNSTLRVPDIPTVATRQLHTHLSLLRRRYPNLDLTVAAIRAGYPEPLRHCLQRAQAGDADAALVVVWALYPRVCAMIIDRYPPIQWRATIDDYLTVVYLTIVGCNPTDPSPHLADAIISRARRRFQRSVEVQRPVPVDDNTVQLLSPSSVSAERTAIARLEVEELGKALANGLLRPAEWHSVVAVRIGRQPGTRTTATDRQNVLRAQRRLNHWRNKAA